MKTVALPDLTHHHFSISVLDMDRAIAWYAEILGFNLEQRFAIDLINAKGAFLRRDSMRIELWELPGNAVPEHRREPDSDLKSGGTKHVAFLVSGLEQRLSDLIERGVDIAAVQHSPAEPMMTFVKGNPRASSPVFAVFIRDPSGVLIELLDQEAIAALSQDS